MAPGGRSPPPRHAVDCELVIELPASLAAAAERGPAWQRWLAALPRLHADLLSAWRLTSTGQVWHGHCSLVTGVRLDDGRKAALKITFDGDNESRDEHLALRRWGSAGAVTLFSADPTRRALLLERLSQETLTPLWDVEACEVVGGLYRRLHVPALPGLQGLGDYVRGWVAGLERDRAEVPIPRRLVDQAIGSARELLADPAVVVVHGDLHYENVLAGARPGPDGTLASTWLAIDPKPMNGWPEYECEPMLRNRYAEYGEAVRWGVRNRLEALTQAGGLDWDRARAWALVRAVVGAHWSFEEAQQARRGLSATERTHITGCISVAKAVQAP